MILRKITFSYHSEFSEHLKV